MKRILIVHTGGGLGDVLLSTSVIHALGEAYPEAEIDFLCLARNAPALRDHPRLNQLLLLEHKAPAAGREWWAWAQRLRSRGYDAALVLWSATSLAWLMFAAGIPIRVGQDSRLMYSFLYTHPVRVRSEHGDSHSHWTDILLDYVRALGIQPGPAQVQLVVPAEARERARALLAALPPREDRPLIVMHSTKGLQLDLPRWPTRAFAEWARALQEELGAQIVLTGTPADRAIVGDIEKQADLEVCLNLCGQTDLMTLAALAQECDVFLCPDSGPMHVAATAGARVVGIYALEEDFPQRWAPYCQRRRIIRPQPSGCRPGCIKAKCPDFRCYHQVQSAHLVAAVAGLLEEFPRPAPVPPHNPSDKSPPP